MVPIGEAFGGLDGLVQAIRDASPQARHHFTQADQVNQLVSASEADPDLGFMARMMALCSLPRTNPGNRLRYVRQNGPYTLVMTAGGKTKLPFGSAPRLLLSWVSTEAVRTQSREIVLGHSPEVVFADLRQIEEAFALTFRDLIEVRFVQAFRHHGVSWKTLRAASSASQLSGTWRPRCWSCPRR